MIAVRPLARLRPSVGVVNGAIVLAILGVALLSGLGRLPGGSQTLLLAIPGVVAIGLLLARLEFGIVMLPVVAAVVPFGVGTGTQSPIVASLLLAVVLLGLWVARMLASGKVAVARSPMNVPLIVFVATAIVASFNVWVMLDPRVEVWPTFAQVQMGGLSLFIVSAGLVLMLTSVFRSIRWVQALVWVYLAVGTVALGGYMFEAPRDIAGLNTNGLFSLWIVALAFGQAVFNRNLPMYARAALLLLVVGWLWRRFFNEGFWVSGWLPALLTVVTIAFLRSWRAGLAFTVVGGVAVLLMLGQVTAILGDQLEGTESQGNSERLDVWSQNLELTQDHLLLGTGVAGYALYYMSFFPTTARSSHSNYLDIFAQTGVVGSLMFLWFVVAVFRAGWMARRRWPTGFGSGLANAVLGGWVGVIVAMALGDWLIPFVYNSTIGGFRHSVHSWVLLGALGSLLHLAPATTVHSPRGALGNGPAHPSTSSGRTGSPRPLAAES